MRNEKELKQRLLNPLKIEKVNAGNEDFGVIGDISITPRDMVKFGLLYLNITACGMENKSFPQIG